MGMMVDIEALLSKPVLVFGAIYTVLAVFAKVLGCALPSWFSGFNLIGGLRVGTGMVPRGEVALIIAGLGLSNGYLSQEIFGIGIMMTLVTTVVAPPALVGLFLRRTPGVKHTKESMVGSRTVHFKLPEGEIANIMFNKLVDAFRKDGFFASNLYENPYRSTWMLAKDDMELSFHRKGKEISVECTPQEEEVFNKAWEDVIGDMIHLANALSKPLAKKEILNTIGPDQPNETKTPSYITRYLQNFVMLPSFKAASKHEAIEKLVDAVAEANKGHVKNIESAKNAVFKREEAMPTGLDHGVALPHGRTDVVDGIMGAVAIVDNSENENGVIPDWETIDHSMIQIIVLTLAPESEQCPYLQLMAYIGRILRGNEGYDEILKCKTETELRNFFRDHK